MSDPEAAVREVPQLTERQMALHTGMRTSGVFSVERASKLYRKRLADGLLGALYAFLLVAALLGLLFISGCASGVQMTDDEAKACRSSGCSAWTDAELALLVQRALAAGYRKGWHDATGQAGRDL